MDEILVHISAPATHQNDELYRSVAEAFVDFEPWVPKADGYRLIGYAGDEASASQPSVTAGLHIQGSDQVSSAASVVYASNESYGSFPSEIFPKLQEEDSQLCVASTQIYEIDSLLNTSRLGQLERIHRYWKQQSATEESHVQVEGSTILGFDKTSFIEETQLAVAAVESQLFVVPSTLRKSAASEDFQVDTGRAQIIPSKAATCVPEPLGTEPDASLEAQSAQSERVFKQIGSHTRRSRTQRCWTRASLSCCSTPQILHRVADTTDSCDFRNLPLQVFPPPPKTTTECPRTLPSQITKYLQMLQRQNTARYNPSQVLRSIDADERGYWIIDCASWPAQDQLEFWSTLCEHIRSGRFGWGVSLHRKVECEEALQQLGKVYLYCWGELVQHIWLALWLCSKGRVSGSGCRWMDAEDVPVIYVL